MMQRLFVENNDYLDVSSDGKIYHNGHELKQRKMSSGYLGVQNQQKDYLVHRLVASAFIQPLKRDDRSKQVHHKNGIKTDNRIENLEILDVKEHQQKHNQKYPLFKTCEVCGQVFIPQKTKRKRAKTCSKECWYELTVLAASKRKKPVLQMDSSGKILKRWDSARDARNETGYNETGINQCCKGKLNTYKGYIWQYA